MKRDCRFNINPRKHRWRFLSLILKDRPSCFYLRKGLTGFTLVEVICSVLVLGLALVAMLGMFTLGTAGNRANEDRTLAYNLLQRKTEEIKSVDFATDVTESGVTYTGFTGYALDVTQTGPPYVGNDNLKKVDVTISWTNPFGSRSETISTLIADYD